MQDAVMCLSKLLSKASTKEIDIEKDQSNDGETTPKTAWAGLVKLNHTATQLQGLKDITIVRHSVKVEKAF